MKKNYLLFFVLLCFVGFSSVAFAQEDRCPNGEFTAGIATPPGVDLLVTGWEVEPASPDHAFIVLGSEEDEAGDRLIKGVSFDGTLDFSAMDDDTYCFVGFAYDQAELDAFVTAANALICPLFGSQEDAPLKDFCDNAENPREPVPVPAELDVVLEVVGAAFAGLTIPSVETAMDTVSGLVADAPFLCYDIAAGEHCVVVENGAVVEVVEVGIEELDANRFELIQNFPNPFSSYTTIAFSTPKATEVSFDVYDLTGRKLFSDQLSTRQGINEYIFEAADFSAGVYFYTITNGDDVITGKMNVK